MGSDRVSGGHGVRGAWGQTEFQVNLKLGLTPRRRWLCRCWRLSEDREKSTQSSESFIKLAMIQLMLHRLRPSGIDPDFRYLNAA